MLKQFVINSGALIADGQGHNYVWQAPCRLQLRKLRTWIGLDAQLPGSDLPFPIVDVFTTVYSAHDPGFIASFFALDYYQHWGGPRQWPEDFEPGQIVLDEGQTIVVGHCCTPVNPARLSHSHTIVFGWYEELGA